MNILAIDSSTKNASVSVQNEGKITSENVLNEITHSEKLLPLIDSVLNKSNISLKNIDMLACTKGPGSFTGIRIGVATVKALSHATSIKIFTMSTLLLISYIEYLNIQSGIKKDTSDDEIYICPCMDAKNDRIYYGLYKFKKDLETKKLIVEELLSPSNDSIVDAINNLKENFQNFSVTFALDNLEVLKESISKHIESFSDITKVTYSSNSILSDSKYIIDYINEVINPDEYVIDYLNFDAVYARMSQAERTCKNEK